MAAQLDTLIQAACEHVCPVPPMAGAVSAIRRRVAAVLAEWNVCEGIVDDSLLVVSELTTNAIIHARPPAELRLSWTRGEADEVLRVEVTDAGPPRPAGQPLGAVDPDEHGRGEAIVQALATRYGTHVHSGGVTRWAEVASL